MADEPDLTAQGACKLVALAAAQKRMITSAKIPDFTESLRKAYYLAKKKPSGEQYHGNAKLSVEDEDLLLGIALGMTRSGDAMGAKEIRALAADLFEGMTFGKDWYDFSFHFSCLPIFNRYPRWDSFSKRRKADLPMGRTKSTSASRTAPETLTGVQVFINDMAERLKGTIP